MSDQPASWPLPSLAAQDGYTFPLASRHQWQGSQRARSLPLHFSPFRFHSQPPKALKGKPAEYTDNTIVMFLIMHVQFLFLETILHTELDSFVVLNEGDTRRSCNHKNFYHQ